MHSSAAPARSAASRGTPNTAELSTTRKGRSRFPPPRLEYRMASISRLGRAISSGKVESDSSLPNSASVSSAVRSSRFAKSDSAVAVVIKKSSRSVWPGQSVMPQASSIAAGLARPRLKTTWELSWANIGYASGSPAIRKYCAVIIYAYSLRKPGIPAEEIRFQTEAEFAPRPKFAADFPGRAAAAISAGAALSCRSSGFDVDGLALAYRRAGQSSLGRFQRDLALLAAIGRRRRGREILQSPRHRLGCIA